MDWKELQHEINMEMTDYFRKHGKNPNTLLLGESEGKVFKNADRSDEFYSDASCIWGMYVNVSDAVDTLIEVSRDESIVEDKPEDISEYVFRESIYVSARFVECFKSFINIQIKDSSGIKLTAWATHMSSFNTDKMFNIRISGLDKDDVHTFGADISNLWNMWMAVINDMFEGDVTWFEEMRDVKEN